MLRLLSAFLSFVLLIPTSVWADADDPRPAEDRAPRADASSLFSRPMVPAGRVRLTTYGAPGAKGGLRYEGQIQAIEDGVIVLGQTEGTVVRLREDDVFGVEVRKDGSAAMGAVGVLLGIPAGLIVAGLVCVTFEECNAGMLWGGVLAGGVLGGVGMGNGKWETVPVIRPSSRRVSLVLQPAPKGGGVGLRVSF